MSAIHVHNRARDRYDALAISRVWNQDTVRSARALVVGTGAVGNEVAKNLAMMGVAAIVVVDRDIVEIANLTRSIFFKTSDHGKPKATVIAERIREFNPDVEVFPLNGELDQMVGLGLVRRMNLIFSCVDNRLARRSLNRLCEKTERPWVDGAMEDLFGQVSVYDPKSGICYECGLSESDLQMMSQVTSCRAIAFRHIASGKVPTTSTLGSILGAVEVQEALKLHHDESHHPLDGKNLVGEKLVINCLANEIYTVKLRRQEGCQGHYRLGPITEVNDFFAGTVSCQDLLKRFSKETGE